MINSYEDFVFENFNHLIIKDFWMLKIWPYFHKSMWIAIFILFSNFWSWKHFFESFRCNIIPMDLVCFPFRMSKLKNDINYIKYKFSHFFGKVDKWLNIHYSNIKIITFFKVISISIWIIFKNLVWIYRECSFSC